MSRKRKVQICITDEIMERIEKLIETLPKKIINGKLQPTTIGNIIELYDDIIHKYYSLERLSDEYEVLDIVDGRRKN